MSDSSDVPVTSESPTQVLPFNARRFVADNFTGDDRVWAEMALLMMQTVGVSREQQQMHLTRAAALCNETGESCETLFGDPLDWATEIGNLDDSVDVPQKSALRRPRRASWKGRFWCASVALIVWPLLATFFLGFVSLSSSPIPGLLYLAVGAVTLYALLWGFLLWSYEGPKYVSESRQALISLSTAAAAALLVFVVAKLWPSVTLWDGTLPAGAQFATLVPGLAGLWTFGGARSVPWSKGPVSNRHWRSVFLGVMTGQKLYPALWAKKHLRELEADAAEIAASDGRAVDLNVLGPAHLVAASFPAAEPENDPIFQRYELQQDFFKALIRAVFSGLLAVCLYFEGETRSSVLLILITSACLGISCRYWSQFQTMRAGHVNPTQA